jgi:hypothetical protein
VRLPAALRLADLGDRRHLRLRLGLADSVVEVGVDELGVADWISAGERVAGGSPRFIQAK